MRISEYFKHIFRHIFRHIFKYVITNRTPEHVTLTNPQHSTLTGNNAPISSGQADMLTTALSDFSVVAGYISCNHTPLELERVITKLARKYAEVYTVYQDLRASVEAFKYPKYRGDFEGDDEEFKEVRNCEERSDKRSDELGMR